MQAPNEADTNATNGQSYVDQDGDMGGTNQPTTHTVDARTTTTQQTSSETQQEDTKVKGDEDEDIEDYEDDDSDDDANLEGEYEAPWFKALLEKLDAR